MKLTDTGQSRKTGNRISETGNRIPETGNVLTVLIVTLLVSSLWSPVSSFAAVSGLRSPVSGFGTVSGIRFPVSGFRFPVSGLAAVQLAHPPTVAPAPTPAPAAPAPAPEPSALAKIVGRLSSAEKQSARDWADLGRETATWGARLQSEQQAVPEGPVRDALAAVDLGSKLDPRVTDWPKLREELEALLKKPEDEQQQKQPEQPDQNDQQQQPQNQDQNKQQKSDQQKQDKSGQPQSNKSDQQDPSQKQDPSEQPDTKPPEPKPPGESAFGDMNKKEEPPPPPPQSTQKVGGAPEKKDAEQPPVDPALALPLQKLEQLRNQDSPAQLFQLMEGDRKPTTKKSGKDW